MIVDSTNIENVVSIFGSVKAPGELKEYLELFARLDMYTPTNADISGVGDVTFDATGKKVNPTVAPSAANTKNTLIIAGLAWKPSAKVTIAADYQGTSFGHNIATMYDDTKPGNAGLSTSDSRFFIHGIVSF